MHIILGTKIEINDLDEKKQKKNQKKDTKVPFNVNNWLMDYLIV